MYKARDRDTGKIVALKKVRFDTSESESVKFMAREIMILQKLDHPNVIKLEGLATSRMHYSLYLVFDFMQCDLSRIISGSDIRLTEPQVLVFLASSYFFPLNFGLVMIYMDLFIWTIRNDIWVPFGFSLKHFSPPML